nr:proteasome accessory factor PafA2 family protein [Mobiluncus mulieris]
MLLWIARRDSRRIVVNHRVVGLETEYGVTLNPQVSSRQRVSAEALSVATAQAVRSWQASLRPDGRAVAWDWAGEDPLADMRGGHLDRASAHPSLLTDNPEVFAPSGDNPGAGVTGGGADSVAMSDAVAAFGDSASLGAIVKPGELGNLASPMLTNVVLSNGGRFYVDHAHPEYATPEVLTSVEAVTWDAAGENIARFAMTKALDSGVDLVLYKNNTDSKGSAYGTHENYLVPRQIPFDKIKGSLVPFLVTRPVICGAGRVGLGQHSENPGFQISQRADFVADLVGLQTTFNRPIVNTRDEPHASTSWRRLHVINGDGNRFQGSILAKVASTRAWLAAIELADKLGVSFPAAGMYFTCDPVEAVWQVSRDFDFSTRLACADGRERSALDWQYEAASRCAEFLASADTSLLTAGARQDAQIWVDTTEMLRAGTAGARVEWVAKHELFSRLAARLPRGWENPKLAALDIRWADLRPGCSPVDKLGTRMEVIVPANRVAAAALQAPSGTRAAERGKAVSENPNLVAASWNTLVVETGQEQLRRLSLGDPIASALYIPEL